MIENFDLCSLQRMSYVIRIKEPPPDRRQEIRGEEKWKRYESYMRSNHCYLCQLMMFKARSPTSPQHKAKTAVTVDRVDCHGGITQAPYQQRAYGKVEDARINKSCGGEVARGRVA